MIFQPITEELIEAVLQILNSNPHYNTLENGNPLRTIEDARHEFLNPDTESYLVLMDNVYIGIIDFLKNNPNDNCPWIGLFMIHGVYHSKGYGRMVYNQFEEKLRQQGYSKVRIGVLLENTSAKRFWSAMGYTFYAYKPWKDKTVECCEKQLI
jgi:GNAT superfamily N-acetyltransferase